MPQVNESSWQYISLTLFVSLFLWMLSLSFSAKFISSSIYMKNSVFVSLI